MTGGWRRLAGALLVIAAIAPAALHAQTVEFTLRDGRVSLVATNATPAQIFEAWSRAGSVLVLNAERLPSTPITVRLDNVSEEQALDTLLRSVSGYLARRRADTMPERSAFERIVILATPAAARETSPAPAPPVRGAAAVRAPFPQAPRVDAAPPPQDEPAGIPQGPGVMRLLGPDGQPVEDDQAGAPPPTVTPYGGADAPNQPPPFAPRPSMPPRSTAPSGTVPGAPTSAPAGVPTPGMVVPAPTTPGQAPNTGQPPRQR